MGFGIRIPSSSPEAGRCGKASPHGGKKRLRMVVDGVEYELRASMYEVRRTRTA